MIKSNPYHERIQRATARLAHLQARELLATHRQAAKAKQAERKEHARRRQRVADLVFLAGAGRIDDGELLGALTQYLESPQDLRHSIALIGNRQLNDLEQSADVH